MTTFTWNIVQLECKPYDGTHSDVVVSAHWSCSGEGQGEFGNVFGCCNFPAPGESFIPYSELTKQYVLEWCWLNGVDKDQKEAEVQAIIDAKLNPPIEVYPLPWDSIVE